jgi:hypothetical protein
MLIIYIVTGRAVTVKSSRALLAAGKRVFFGVADGTAGRRPVLVGMLDPGRIIVKKPGFCRVAE